MSTGAECNFVEKDGKWQYRLQDYPYGYTESYHTYGPFSSFRAAMDHLERNHANPGGFSVSMSKPCTHPAAYRRKGEGYDPLFRWHSDGTICDFCGDFIGSEAYFEPEQQVAIQEGLELAKTVCSKVVRGLKPKIGTVTVEGHSVPGLVLAGCFAVVAFGHPRNGQHVTTFLSGPVTKKGRTFVLSDQSRHGLVGDAVRVAASKAAAKVLSDALAPRK